MASGQVNRTNRPNTWLHRPSLRREDFSCQPGAVGPERPGCRCPLMGRIVLQNSQNALRLISRKRTKQATIADQCALKRGIEVAREFIASWCGPPHDYLIAAPTARRINAPCCKKTFATQSARNGHADHVARRPLSGAKRKTYARIELFRF